MNPPPASSPASARQRILAEMATIEQMEYGQLDTFFKPSPTAPGQRRGPYHKRQVWRDGKNQTEYVPAAQVPAVQAAIAGRERFEHAHHQSLADYIDGQHSAATWSRAAMGPALAADFDRQLQALLAPFAEGGMIELRYVSTLAWGAPRRTSRA